MHKKRQPQDPKGLVYEAYRIDGITKPDCRTIFLDWALSLPNDQEQSAAIATLLGQYENQHGTHPMTKVLREGLQATEAPKRRGGWRARRKPEGDH